MIATAPFMLTYPLVALLLGIGFGFVLESSGFGDSRKLAAQFYFTEMRVLKVMFTAIVTCMLLLVWTWSVGWLDFDPTNNKIPMDQHITTAWGRDYADITPLKGIIFGGSKHKARVGVDVQRI